MLIELVKPHTHAGELLAAGTRIELDEQTARWLVEIGTARPCDEPALPSSNMNGKSTRKGD